MPKWLDRFLDDATSPLEQGQVGEKSLGLVQRTFKSATQGLADDMSLPIVHHVGTDEDGDLAIYDTSSRRKGVLSRAAAGVVRDFQLPVGYVVARDEDGGEVIVNASPQGRGGGAMRLVVDTVVQNLTPDVVESSSRAAVGFARDMVGGFDYDGLSDEQYQRMMEDRVARDARMRDIAERSKNTVVGGGKLLYKGLGVAGKGLADVIRSVGGAVGRRRENNAGSGKKGSTPLIIDHIPGEGRK